jgi:acyl-CoA thioesterase FadM
MILPLRIYYEDTDFSSFVYHASAATLTKEQHAA